MRGSLLAGAGVVGLLAAMPAWANDAETEADPRDRITVTATRAPLATQEAPATVSVIGEEQIADELVTDIKDLIRFEPGVSVARQPARFGAASGTTGRAGNEGFNIRGIGGNRVLIQVDGVRVPDGFLFGAHSVGRGDYVDLGLVKSVEILRGPASALYGSDGLAGAVSFITSDPVDLIRDGNSFGGLARASYSSADNEFSETLIVAGRAGDWSAMAAYTRRDFNEMETTGTIDRADGYRTTANPQDGRSNAALGRIVYESGGHKLRLTGEYVGTRLYADVLSGRTATVVDLWAVDTGHRWRGALDWRWEGAGLVEAARLAAYLQDSEDRQFTYEDRNPAVDRTRINNFDNRVYGGSGEVRLNFGTTETPLRLILGVDGSKTDQSGVRDGTVPPAGETFPTTAFPQTDYTLVGAFAAGELTFGPVTFYPALRWDHYDLSPDTSQTFGGVTAVGQTGSHLSPKLGAVVKIGDELRLFGGYSQGFKAPEPGQVNQFFGNLAFGYIAAPNPDLKPETSESFEVGARYLGRNVRLDVAGFHADYDDFISREVVSGLGTPSNPSIFKFINIDRVRVKGAEARFEAWNDAGFTARVAISWATGTRIAPSGAKSPLLTIDPLKVVMGAGWRDPAGRFGGQLIATHSATKEEARAGTNYVPEGFTTLDLTAFVKVGDMVTLRGGIFNLTDEKYSWWSDVQGLGRTTPVTSTGAAPYAAGTLTQPTSVIADAYTQPGRNASVSLSVKF